MKSRGLIIVYMSSTHITVLSVLSIAGGHGLSRDCFSLNFMCVVLPDTRRRNWSGIQKFTKVHATCFAYQLNASQLYLLTPLRNHSTPRMYDSPRCERRPPPCRRWARPRPTLWLAGSHRGQPRRRCRHAAKHPTGRPSCLAGRRAPAALQSTTHGSFPIRRQRDHPGVVLPLVISNSANH